jgi:four helix bundle protein
MRAEDKKTIIQDFTDLVVWQLAHQLRKDVYLLVAKLPKTETYGLSSQLRRAAVSIAANIAEGYGRFHFQENIQFCRQARGSLEEVKDGIIFARDIELLPHQDCDAVLARAGECRQVLNGYVRSLSNSKRSIPLTLNA